MGVKITASPVASAKPNGGDPASPPTPISAPASHSPAARVRPMVSPRAPKSSKNSARVLMTVLDGKIEWEKMDATARKAFEDLFKDKLFLKQFGVAAAEKIFKPEQMAQLYDGVSMMYQTVCGMVLRWPAPILKCLAYTDEQKEILAEPTANLANEFAPDFLKRNSTLLIFLSVFGAVTQKNFLEASAKAKELAAQRRPAQQVISAEKRPTIVPAPADRPAPTISVPFASPAPGTFQGESLD